MVIKGYRSQEILLLVLLSFQAGIQTVIIFQMKSLKTGLSLTIGRLDETTLTKHNVIIKLSLLVKHNIIIITTTAAIVVVIIIILIIIIIMIIRMIV